MYARMVQRSVAPHVRKLDSIARHLESPPHATMGEHAGAACGRNAFTSANAINSTPTALFIIIRKAARASDSSSTERQRNESRMCQHMLGRAVFQRATYSASTASLCSASSAPQVARKLGRILTHVRPKRQRLRCVLLLLHAEVLHRATRRSDGRPACCPLPARRRCLRCLL